jgi:hypothetical protein
LMRVGFEPTPFRTSVLLMSQDWYHLKLAP